MYARSCCPTCFAADSTFEIVSTVLFTRLKHSLLAPASYGKKLANCPRGQLRVALPDDAPATTARMQNHSMPMFCMACKSFTHSSTVHEAVLLSRLIKIPERCGTVIGDGDGACGESIPSGVPLVVVLVPLPSHPSLTTSARCAHPASFG